MAQKNKTNAKQTVSKSDVKRAAKAYSKLSKTGKTLVVCVLVLAIVCAVVYGVYFYKNVAPTPLDHIPSGSISWTDGELQLHFIDVGQGDCTVIKLPDGKIMVIDGGEQGKQTEILPYMRDKLGVDYVDYLMLTHSDSDHCGSLDDIVNAYEVHNFYVPKLEASYIPNTTEDDKIKGSISTKVYKQFVDSMRNETYIESGKTKSSNIHYNIGEFSITGRDYTIKAYAPEESYYATISNQSTAEVKNSVSPICILEYKGKRIVLTGDANEISEEKFIKASEVVDTDVLKVGHHGSSTSTTPEFLKHITPEHFVISSNPEGNNYGHPHKETLDRIAKIRGEVYRTDTVGDIMLKVDGLGKMQFYVERAA